MIKLKKKRKKINQNESSACGVTNQGHKINWHWPWRSIMSPRGKRAGSMVERARKCERGCEGIEGIIEGIELYRRLHCDWVQPGHSFDASIRVK